jgi:hypothetical protein
MLVQYALDQPTCDAPPPSGWKHSHGEAGLSVTVAVFSPAEGRRPDDITCFIRENLIGLFVVRKMDPALLEDPQHVVLTAF